MRGVPAQGTIAICPHLPLCSFVWFFQVGTLPRNGGNSSSRVVLQIGNNMIFSQHSCGVTKASKSAIFAKSRNYVILTGCIIRPTCPIFTKKYVKTRHTSNKPVSRTETVLRKRRPRNECSKFGLLEKIQGFSMLRLSVGNQHFR